MKFNAAMLRASVPAIVALLATLGVFISPAFSAFITTNPLVLDWVIAGLALWFPSMFAAVKYDNSAD